MTNGGASNGPEKGNEYAIEALKQVLTLAGAVLALTITFLNDGLGEGKPSAHLQWLVPISWFLLMVVIWAAWIAMADAAVMIGTSNGVPFAFGSIDGKPTTAKVLAIVAQLSFGLAMTCLTIFATANVPIFFRASGSGAAAIDTTSVDRLRPISSATLRLVGTVGPFVTGHEDKLEGDAAAPSELSAVLRKELDAAPMSRVVLVGVADKFPLRGALIVRYGSNAGLARARAEWVARQLGGSMGSMLPYTSLTVGPGQHGAALSADETRSDRSVAVYVSPGSGSR